MKDKKLKYYNGRGNYIDGVKWRFFYVAAYSQKQAAELIEDSITELTKYYSQCWGNQMNGITTDLPGLWAVKSHDDNPVKIK